MLGWHRSYAKLEAGNEGRLMIGYGGNANTATTAQTHRHEAIRLNPVIKRLRSAAFNQKGKPLP